MDLHLNSLNDEGFVRCGQVLQRGLVASNVVLTSKGSAILNSTPDFLKEKITLVERIKRVASNGTQEAINSAIQVVIGGWVSAGI